MNIGLQRTSALDVDALRREVDAVFVLPATIVDRVSFFDACRATLPEDPPAHSSWDALEDSLWEGLHQHPATRIAILWPAADLMERQASHDFKTALEVLDDVARMLADAHATVGRTKKVSVLVELRRD